MWLFVAKPFTHTNKFWNKNTDCKLTFATETLQVWLKYTFFLLFETIATFSVSYCILPQTQTLQLKSILDFLIFWIWNFGKTKLQLFFWFWKLRFVAINHKCLNMLSCDFNGNHKWKLQFKKHKKHNKNKLQLKNHKVTNRKN